MWKSIILIIVMYISLIIYLNNKFRLNFVPALISIQYKRKKKKPESRKDIFFYNISEIMFWINDFLMGRPNHSILLENHLPFKTRLNLLIRLLQHRPFDMWSYNSFRAHEGWHIRTWNTFRPFNRLKADINYQLNNLPNNGHRRLSHTPFLKNTHSFTEKHCFDANRQIWGNNSYIAHKGFWSVDQVYKDPVLRKNNNFLRHVKETQDSYIIEYYQVNSRSDNLYDPIQQENKALRTMKSLRIAKGRASVDIFIEKINKEIEKYEKQQAFYTNPENFRSRPFSSWRDYVFDSYETNFYEIERKHATLLINRLDLHFDLETDHYDINGDILNDIRKTERNLLIELLRKPFFN